PKTSIPTTNHRAKRIESLLYLTVGGRLAILRRGIGGRGHISAIIRKPISTHDAILILFHDHSSHVRNGVIRLEVDDAHALGIATLRADVVHVHADHQPFARHDHEVIRVEDAHHGHELARLRRGLHRDDALAAARLHAILVELRALAVPVLTDGEHLPIPLREDDHADDLLVGPE